jgi:hypothetical protein
VSSLPLRWRVSAGLATLVAVGIVLAILASACPGDPAHSPRLGRLTSAPPGITPAGGAASRGALTIGAPVGRTIRAGFLGLSIEFQAVRAYTGVDPARINPVLVQLIRNITPDQAPVIRIGGDSTDASWVPSPAAHPGPAVTYPLTRGWFATTGALARELGAKMIMGLNLAANEPGLASVEARRDVQTFGSSLEAFEIGNEPNVYGKIATYHTPAGVPVRARPRDYDYPEFRSEFKAIASGLPALPLAGPALATGPTAGPGSWINTMVNFLHSEPRLSIMTVHRYPLRNCFVARSSRQYPSVPHLLSSYSTVDLAGSVLPWLRIAHSQHRELRVDELNSVACRGKHGVSDTFASGLWVLDALFELARLGVDGVNMHTLPDSAYELFKFSHTGGQWQASVPPVYYGLEMFAQAAPPGSQLLRTSGGHLSAGLSVWATRAPGGQVRAVLINESPSHGQRVSLSPPAGAGASATVLRMRAPSVRAQGHVSIGGASFGPETSTGLLPPTKAQPVAAKRGLYTIPMPPGSAALVTFSSSSG